ncbi:HK97 family phage prohead protease [Bradyrhizobium sp. SZCCHNR1020]|uniref:HK97 family phage prohead protease n=1 Tax=Bradyrhizobium sp. SZCCHNR1020 TaxID=3057343 RepID=UPI002917005A|nr:HK97 family phage prohead protease [Bradyrhizobium sp. SZCCHNR1020]
MKRRTIVDITEFQRRVKLGHKPGVAVRFATDGQAQLLADGESRSVSFVFSDGSVDRYGDTINPRGWVLDAFNANPIALFGHDTSSVENVIGRASNVRVEGDRLIGDIEFMSGDVNPNAEAVFQMVKAGFLRTVSVGFQPIEWVAAKDRSRPGGIDFKKQELVEISVVPVPANGNALSQAKAAGIDIDRLGLTTAYAAPSPKGLYEVSWLADLLASLGYLSDCVAWEADYEGDGSEIPGQLADALRQLGAVLVAMTAEEVAELLAGDDEDEAAIMADDPIDTAGFTPAQKALIRFAALGRRARSRKPPELTLRAGKVLSSANEQMLRDAHDCITKGCDMVRSVFEQATTDEPDDDQSRSVAPVPAADADAVAVRERKARALKRKHGLAAA